MQRRGHGGRGENGGKEREDEEKMAGKERVDEVTKTSDAGAEGEVKPSQLDHLMVMVNSLRDVMASGQASLKDEMARGQASLKEMASRQDSWRKEMASMQNSFREKMATRTEQAQLLEAIQTAFGTPRAETQAYSDCSCKAVNKEEHGAESECQGDIQAPIGEVEEFAREEQLEPDWCPQAHPVVEESQVSPPPAVGGLGWGPVWAAGPGAAHEEAVAGPDPVMSGVGPRASPPYWLPSPPASPPPTHPPPQPPHLVGCESRDSQCD